MLALEAEIRRRFTVRTETFAHGSFRAELLLPASPEALIDESEFNADERLPYWAELWPAARALARHLLDGPAPAGRVLELGCGIALPSLALRWRGAEVLATDYYPDALLFARANAARNGLPTPATTLLDWRESAPQLGRFDLILAADVLYEQRNAQSLAAALPRLLAPTGKVLLADPQRVYLAEFRQRMRAAGWKVEAQAAREPAATEGTAPVHNVHLLQLCRGE